MMRGVMFQRVARGRERPDAAPGSRPYALVSTRRARAGATGASTRPPSSWGGFNASRAGGSDTGIFNSDPVRVMFQRVARGRERLVAYRNHEGWCMFQRVARGRERRGRAPVSPAFDVFQRVARGRERPRRKYGADEAHMFQRVARGRERHSVVVPYLRRR